MKYMQSRSNFSAPKKTGSGGNKWIWVFGILIIVLVIVVMVLVTRKPETIIDDASETVESSVVVNDEVVEPTLLEAETTANFEEISLEYVGTVDGGWDGVARRGEEGELFTHVVVATLPQIDYSTQFYEGWLVKPRVVEFFSTGEMFPRDDGKWGLVWESETSEELFDYSEVVITLEPRDGDPAPAAAHILEGNF